MALHSRLSIARTKGIAKRMQRDHFTMAPNTSLASPPSSVGASDDGHPKCNHAPSSSVSDKKIKPPKLGPDPTLLSRRQVDALYSLLEAVTHGLNQLGIPYL